MNVAIVGSEEKYWEWHQRDFVIKEIVDILKVLDVDEPPRLISGGCPKGGVDIWAEVVAITLGYPRTIFRPGVNQWEDGYDDGSLYDESGKLLSYDPHMLWGYKSRNIKIAEFCDILYCFDPKDRDWSGGVWTYNKALELGKEAHHIAV